MIPLMILSYLSALASIRPDFMHVLLLSYLFKSHLVLNVKRKDTLLKRMKDARTFKYLILTLSGIHVF